MPAGPNQARKEGPDRGAMPSHASRMVPGCPDPLWRLVYVPACYEGAGVRRDRGSRPEPARRPIAPLADRGPGRSLRGHRRGWGAAEKRRPPGGPRGAAVPGGLTAPDYAPHLVMAGLGYEFPVRALPVAVELGAGAGLSRFQPTGTAGLSAQDYFGVNGGARIIFRANRRLRAELTPQVDVAFADRARLGESRAWLWPVAVGLQYRF